MEEGRVVERGTFRQLMAKEGGTFRALHSASGTHAGQEALLA
jgi:ABC-type multidrug transport system fused ATPase/permease subunit